MCPQKVGLFNIKKSLGKESGISPGSFVCVPDGLDVMAVEVNRRLE